MTIRMATRLRPEIQLGALRWESVQLDGRSAQGRQRELADRRRGPLSGPGSSAHCPRRSSSPESPPGRRVPPPEAVIIRLAAAKLCSQSPGWLAAPSFRSAATAKRAPEPIVASLASRSFWSRGSILQPRKPSGIPSRPVPQDTRVMPVEPVEKREVVRLNRQSGYRSNWS